MLRLEQTAAGFLRAAAPDSTGSAGERWHPRPGDGPQRRPTP
ncbi:hypothetical protein SSCG_01731 [Streptomyces clavuligerus]|nr:hypothetical protein SSCG_01731 [Streptomyces clavuligerus]